MSISAKKILRKTGKVLLWIIASIVFLILLVYILIQIPAVQEFGKKKIVSYLQKKIKTKVSIDHLSLEFPKRLVLEGVYFEDQRKDTLLAAQKLRVDIALFKLLKSEVEIGYLGLDGVRGNIYRTGSDTLFNYDYIVKAFMSDQEKDPADTAASTMKFKLDQIVFNNIHATFKDDQTGNDVDFNLGHFDTRIKTFDLQHSIYEVPDINISGIRATVKQYKPLMTPQPVAVVEAESNQPMDLDLRLKTINLKDIQFAYDNTLQALSTRLNLGEMIADVKNINLKTLLIQLNKIELNNTKIAVGLGKSPQAVMVANEVAKKSVAQANNPWKIELGKLLFKNDDVQFENDNLPKQSSGMDYAHLNIKGLNLDADTLAFTPTEYKGRIANLSMTERGGLDLQKLATSFYYGPKEAYLDNLIFQTPNSSLGNKIRITYPSADSMATHPGEIFVDADLNESRLAVKDLLVFMPTLPQQMPAINRYRNNVLRINTNIRGYVKDLNIPVFQLSGIGSTSIAMSGNIKGLPDATKATFDLKLNNFKTTRADLESFLPKGSIPPNIRLPETIAAQGAFKGNSGVMGGKLSIQTERGSASVDGNFNANNKSYNATIALNNLDAGYFAKQEKMLGHITLKATAKGSGFDMKTANAVVDATIQQAFANGYNYTNLQLNANVKKGNAVVKARMNDRNIAFDLSTTANLNSKFPAVKLDLQLDTLNLQRLKLLPANYRLKGHIVADLPGTNPDALVGTVSINNLVFMDSVRAISLDSISVTAANNGATETIDLQSRFATLRLDGQYKLSELGNGIQQTINRYYALPNYKPLPFSPQAWTLTAKITPAGELATMFPQLKGTDTMRVDMAFNSAQNLLNLSARAPLIVFGAQKIDSLTITANTNGNQLDYAATLNYAGSKDFFVNRTSLTGNLANNILNADLDIKDPKQQTKYALGVILNALPTGVKASLKPNLILNKEKWAAGAGNYIQYDQAGIIVNNLVISQGNESLGINSQSLSPTAPIEVRFNNFQIGTLTRFAEQANVGVGGTINGNAVVKNAMTVPVFTSDLAIQNLTYGKDTLGNLNVKVDNETANAYNADVRITGYGNDARLTGKYYTGESRMDLNLQVNTLNLLTAKKILAPDILTDASGNIRGNIAVKGTLDRPSVVGELRFEKAYITPTMLGERFYFNNEAIVVTTRDIVFDRFTIADSSGNKAIIDGNIYTSDFKNFKFDMDFTARNFRAVNVARKSGSTFFGRLNLDTDLKVRGTVNAPSITADLKINRSTDFTIITPTPDPELVSRDGVVRFVDYSRLDSGKVVINPLDTIISTELKGIDLTANIETDTAAMFTMIIDERSGDALKIQGRADLAATMDKSGKISLTGDYEVTRGSYQLSFNFLKRRFDIQRGSTLTWTGDPTSANVNITAVYIARTASIDLMQSQLAGQNAELTKYKQKLPFNVLLKMNGELMKPIITFDVVLPEDRISQWQDVSAKLEQIRRDDAELNKQVFALLLLGRFVGENPFQSAGEGTSTGTQLRQSASGILTDQLNKLAGSLVSGVDLNFGVSSEDDYSTGTKSRSTDLTVGVSKSLLNDRLKVSVGSNFELEGPKNSNKSANNIAGDLAIDYQLSRDGTYLLRAYRKNRYEGVIDGQIVETGVSFIFTLDYDTFKELFKRPTAEERKERKETKKVEKEAAKEEKKDLEQKEKADTTRPKQ